MYVTHAVKYSPFTIHIIFRIIDKNKTVWFVYEKWTTKVLVWHFCYISISICAWVSLTYLFYTSQHPHSTEKNMENFIRRENISMKISIRKFCWKSFKMSSKDKNRALFICWATFFPNFHYVCLCAVVCLHNWYSHAIFHQFSHNQYFTHDFLPSVLPIHLNGYTCASECVVRIVCDIELVEVQTF